MYAAGARVPGGFPRFEWILDGILKTRLVLADSGKICYSVGNTTERRREDMELEQLRSDMVAAMKARDKDRKDAISSLVSAVKKVAIDEGCREDVPAELVDRVITKELKTAKEQLDTCPAEREDLRAEYQKRYDVIAEYAPKMMSPEEVKAYIEEHFEELIATKNKGQVMKAVMGVLKGKADGKVINETVARLCE